MKKIIVFLAFISAFTFSSSLHAETLFGKKNEVPIDKSWTIKFNTKIDPNSVNDHIWFTYQGEVVADVVFMPKEIEVTGQTITVHPPLELFEADQSYRLHIDGVKSAEGIEMKNTVVFDFTTATSEELLSTFEKKVVTLTNKERTAKGLKPLTMDDELSKVARLKSIDMAENNYFSHNSPTYGSPFDMMRQFDIDYRAAGENIAAGQRSPEQVVEAWMNSDGHRANILSKSYTHIGVGFAESGHYWTQQFIGK